MKISTNQVWWCMPVIPPFGKLKQENQEFKANLGNIARHCEKRKEGREGEKYPQTRCGGACL
jgi:hypothetical protein